MKLPRLAVLCAIVLTAGLALPAQAAPPSQESYAAPYDGARGLTFVNCAAGATCTPTASATPDGAAEGSVSYSRQVGVEAAESVSAHGRVLHVIRMPHKADAATITLVWDVANAESTSASTAGSLLGVSYLWGKAWCNGGCADTYRSQTVSFCGAPSPVPCSPTNAKATPGTRTLTLKVSDVRGQFVTVATAAAAYVGGDRGCIIGVSQCDVQSPDATHAGSASSSIKATLKSISVEAA